MSLSGRAQFVAISRLGAQPLLRSLHTTVVSSEFFSWFKKKKDEQNQAAVINKDTREVIKDIEEGKEAKTTNKQKLELKPENFIGEERGKIQKRDHQKLVKSISFNGWLSEAKVATEEQLDSILIESLNSSLADGHPSSVNDPKFEAVFPDLVTKFKFTKFLQAKTGYIIPDYTLTILATPSQFKSYYIKEILSGKLAKYKESEPNAIDLSGTQFTSSNVYVVPEVNVALQKKKFGKIMREVQLLEAENARRAIEQVKLR